MNCNDDIIPGGYLCNENLANIQSQIIGEIQQKINNMILDLVRQLLGREPTEWDYGRMKTLPFHNLDNWGYGLIWDGSQIGTITIEITPSGGKYTITFKPAP
jgi:hypothetical protein